MRCPYCKGSVVGDSKIVIIVGEGPAHASCHESHIISERTYKGVNFSSMNIEDLNEMKEMLLIELNARGRSEYTNESCIELFA